MELPIDDIATCFRVHKLMTLNDITSTVDADYTCLNAFVKGEQRFNKIGDSHIAKLFQGVMNDHLIRTVDDTELVIMQGTHIIVPFPARKFVIRDNMTLIPGSQKASSWPSNYITGQTSIKSYIDSCVPC